MALFAAVSTALSWLVVSYALFATGIAAVILGDCTDRGSMKKGAGVCVALPGVGLLGGAGPALLLIVPAAFTAVAVTGSLSLRKSQSLIRGSRSGESRDDPLTNVCVSLPSAVALLAFLALA